MHAKHRAKSKESAVGEVKQINCLSVLSDPNLEVPFGRHLNVTRDKATALLKACTATNVFSEIGTASYRR